jgi:hypothetical protein
MGKNFKPVLIRKIQGMADQEHSAWAAAKKDLAGVLAAYAITGLPALSNADLKRLFSEPFELLFDKLAGGNTHLVSENGEKLKVDKASALAILHKPSGYNELLATVKSYQGTGHKIYHVGTCNAGFPVSAVTQYYEINAVGDLTETELLSEILEEAGNCWVKTEKGADIANFCQALADAYFANNMDKHVNFTGDKITVERVFDITVQCMHKIDYHTKKAELVFSNGNQSFYGDGPGLLT